MSVTEKIKELARKGFVHRGFLTRYGISGACGAATQVATLYVWVSVLGFKDHYLWGVVVGFGLAVVVSFLLQKYWTFRDFSHQVVGRQATFYILTSLGSLALNALLLHTGKIIVESLGFDFFRIWYLVIQIGVVGFVAILSFLSNFYITFASRRS